MSEVKLRRALKAAGELIAEYVGGEIDPRYAKGAEKTYLDAIAELEQRAPVFVRACSHARENDCLKVGDEHVRIPSKWVEKIEAALKRAGQ